MEVSFVCLFVSRIPLPMNDGNRVDSAFLRESHFYSNTALDREFEY